MTELRKICVFNNVKLRNVEIIQGKLDQQRALLEVDNTIGRDIRAEDVPIIVSTLEAWCDACENVLGSLQTQMDRATLERVNRMQRKEQLEQEACLSIRV
jgi:COP9 signalosome complex subunit 7